MKVRDCLGLETANKPRRCNMKIVTVAVAMVLLMAGATFASDLQPADGVACKDLPFSGKVAEAVLSATGGKGADAIEIIDRIGKKPVEQRFKVKRLRIAEDGVAVALQTSSECFAYVAPDVERSEIEARLLRGGETMRPLAIDASKDDHNTFGVFVIE